MSGLVEISLHSAFMDKNSDRRRHLCYWHLQYFVFLHRSLHYELYHSLCEWSNHLFEREKNSSFKSQEFVVQNLLPELYSMVVT